ncbi:MAG: shikimate dehydrogenase, partial [Nitrospinae bacterium]|nr:shikimate dehydrogenase [Nitrospinota bacterium]
NTVAKEGNVWTGHNTDCSGALKALEERIPLSGKNVLIVGAGGTAKAIGQGVAERGARLTITYNRDKNRGETLARELQCRLISVRDIEDCPADVLINCSPAGMNPKVNETPVPARALRPGMVVFDSVYNPPETRLIKEAKAAGCTTISGIELFINQGAEQFELWTGMKAPVAAMRSALTAALGG